MIVGLVLFLIVLIFFSAFTSSSETALFSLSPMKVRVFRDDASPRKKLVAQLLAQPRTLLVTIMILNVLMNISIQNVVSNLFGSFNSWLLSVGVPLVITLILGEVIPKSLGLANNARLAYVSAPFLHFSKKILLPLRVLLEMVASRVSSVMFFFLKKEKDLSSDELHITLKRSHKIGVLSEDESELIRGYLHLQEENVKELMRPKEEILFYDFNQPHDQLLHIFIDQECTRVPVCVEDLDNLKGIISAKDFFLAPAIENKDQVKELIQKPYYVAESMSAESLLHEFYRRQESIAIVVDEYGTISGLITLEDLFEEVIGEIVDRRDAKKLYTRSGSDVIIASGKLELFELEELFGCEFESEHSMLTIGGWLTEKIGDIPKSGTKHIEGDFLFHVLHSDPNRVRRVYIRRMHPGKE